MVTSAMGLDSSAPMPVLKAMVLMARMVVRAVIRMGRMRVLPVSMRAARFSMPSSRSWLA